MLTPENKKNFYSDFVVQWSLVSIEMNTLNYLLLEIHACSNPRIGFQTTIFSEHEVFEDCCHFYPFDIFAKLFDNIN